MYATPKKKGKGADFNLGGIIHTYSFAQALQDKIILDPVIKIVFYSVNETLFHKIENNNQNTMDLAESAFNDFLPEESENNDQEGNVFTSKNTDFIGIQKILKNKFHIGKENAHQTLVFVNRIKKADLLNQMLQESFSKKVSHSYHSKSDSYHVKDNFNKIKTDFANHIFNVLISVGTLGEGIDFPYASHGIIASPIYNSGAFVQKVGRLLRSYEGHKKATIYYYVPSELVTRLITDEKIEPNYFKSIVKIAAENKDLYFVDRQSMKEEKGSMEDLLIQGSAYERNDYIKSIKMPHDLDAIMRFYKRVHPDKIKRWKRVYTREVNQAEDEKNISFIELRDEMSRSFRATQFFANNIISNLSNLKIIQKKFSNKEFTEFSAVRAFVKKSLQQRIIVKIKYGHELEQISSKESVFSHSEGEMLVNMIAAELKDFCVRQKDIKKTILGLKKAVDSLEAMVKKDHTNEDVIKARIKSMSAISKHFFYLQSSFLDELDIAMLAKAAKHNDEKVTLTLGKDIFLSKHSSKLYAYPEDFGFSRWQEVKEEKETPRVIPPEELFVTHLLSIAKVEHNYEQIAKNWKVIKQDICDKLKITIQKDAIIITELEKQKRANQFSFETIFFVLDAINKHK